MPAHGPINPLTMKMTAAAWSRILTAIRDSGLNLRTVGNREELHAYIRDNVPIITIGAADWAAAPPLNLAGGNAAARAAAGRIRFIGLASVATLEIQTGPLATIAPWTVISKLVGAIGAVGTQAARVDEMSQVQSVGEVLRTNSRVTTDPAMAKNLRSDLTLATLPKALRAHGASPPELSEEISDAIEYKQSEASRKAIEQKRLHCLSPW